MLDSFDAVAKSFMATVTDSMLQLKVATPDGSFGLSVPLQENRVGLAIINQVDAGSRIRCMSGTAFW